MWLLVKRLWERNRTWERDINATTNKDTWCAKLYLPYQKTEGVGILSNSSQSSSTLPVYELQWYLSNHFKSEVYCSINSSYNYLWVLKTTIEEGCSPITVCSCKPSGCYTVMGSALQTRCTKIQKKLTITKHMSLLQTYYSVLKTWLMVH